MNTYETHRQDLKDHIRDHSDDRTQLNYSHNTDRM